MGVNKYAIAEPNDLDNDGPLENRLKPGFKNLQAQALAQFIHMWGTQKTPSEFYRDVFPMGSLADAVTQEKEKYAAHVFKTDTRSEYLNDDLEAVLKYTPKDIASMSYIAYAGRGKTAKLARELYALIFKVILPDEVRPFHVDGCLSALKTLIDSHGGQYPRTPRICPTYILTDQKLEEVYFCYILNEPIPMYHRIHSKIQRLYDALSRAIHREWDITYWDEGLMRLCYTYECKKPLPNSIFHRYPVVGTKATRGEFLAYKVDAKYDVDELEQLVPKASRLGLYEPQLTLEEAKVKYPSWYRWRIEQHRKPLKQKNNESMLRVYNWYLDEVKKQSYTINPGAMEALASYAAKADIDEEVFNADLEMIQSLLKDRFSAEELEEHKTRAKEWLEEIPHILMHWGISGISKWSGLQIEPNKRNYRTQAEHLKIVHDSQSCEDKVLEWVKANPGGTQTACSEELGISRKTVSKWWHGKKSRKKAPTQATDIPQPNKTSGKNLCPDCGAEMTRTKIGPYFLQKKGQFYAHYVRDCPNCHCHIKGKSYVCQKPTS